MKRLMIIAVAALLPMIANADMTNDRPESLPTTFPQYVKQDPQTRFTQPSSWHWIGAYNGPAIPAGWQVVNVESLVQNGTMVRAWMMYLYNPTTHQTAGWLIGVD